MAKRKPKSRSEIGKAIHASRIEHILRDTARLYDEGFIEKKRGESKEQYLNALRDELQSCSAADIAQYAAL